MPNVKSITPALDKPSANRSSTIVQASILSIPCTPRTLSPLQIGVTKRNDHIYEKSDEYRCFGVSVKDWNV